MAVCPIPADFASADHSNFQSEALAVTFTFPVLATIAVSLRLYSRSMTRTFGYDDWFICVASVLFWAQTVVTYKFVVDSYVGYHCWDVPLAEVDFMLVAKYIYAAEMIYVPILGIIKISIMIFLFRLSGHKLGVKRTIQGLVVIIIAVTTVNQFMVTFQCLPVASIWNKEAYPNAKCVDFSKVTIGFASIGVITDVLALILPTWIVYDLKIARQQKLMLIGILSFGLITVISGLVRAVLLAGFDTHPPADFTHSILFCISSIEVGLAIVVACAPYMKPLIVKVAPKVFGSSRFGRTGGQSAHTAHKLTDSRTWKGTQTMTHVDANGDNFNATILKAGGLNDKTDIMMTRETEVRWQENPHGAAHTSTESLV